MSYDAGYYEAARRGVNDQYAAQMAANTYSQQLSQTRGQRNLAEMQQGFKRSMPGFNSQFGQRGFGGGIGRSGVMRQAMSNYLGDFTRDYSTAQSDFTEQMRQFQLNASQLGAQRSSALADLELQKNHEIAYAAQNIAALRELLGGT